MLERLLVEVLAAVEGRSRFTREYVVITVAPVGHPFVSCFGRHAESCTDLLDKHWPSPNETAMQTDNSRAAFAVALDILADDGWRLSSSSARQHIHTDDQNPTIEAVLDRQVDNEQQ